MQEAEPFYAPAPWVRFEAVGASRTRWCQPDGLFLDLEAGQITIVEIKYQHTALAWWQVRRLYEPVLQAIFPPNLFSFAALEIVSWLDPDVEFPERWHYAPEPSRVPPGGFGVHIARERHLR